MTEISPSKVLKLVPEATAPQLSEFLELAEAMVCKKVKPRRKPPRAPSRSKTPGSSDRISLSGQSADVKANKGLDSPTESNSQFMKELKKLVPPKDGGSAVATIDFNKEFQNKLLNLLEASNTPTQFDAEHFEKVYKKLEKDPLSRSRLENLHAARAHKYGYAHFGPKRLFRESTKLAKKLKSQAERRKFRAGLKGLLDFLNQLNLMDLEKLLEKGDSEGFKTLKLPGLIQPETMCKYLKDVPPIKLIEFINRQRATKIRTLLTKISSLAHFSQSMTDFFAHDDALEPALAVVCDVLRNNDKIGGVLDKNSSFLSMAQPYDKNRSKDDHDVLDIEKSKKTTNLRRPQRSRQNCFFFQNGTCWRRSCTFKHACNRCGSSRHGRSDCKEKKRRRDRSERLSKSRR